jgi:hypothetical protein
MASKSKKLSKVEYLQTFFEFKNPTHAQKNKYEEVIDEMMKSEVSKRYPDLKEIFDKAYSSNTEKRQAILSVLDNNRGLFYKINRDIGTSTHLDPQSRIAELIVMLRDYIKVGEVERKLYGEVLTPITLVDEMLDGLPKKVWENPDLKWLDPANGCGIFPAVIVKRLMSGLESWEPNKEKRYKHIMEKMIHVCELQPKNMFLFLCAFDPKDEYALNVYTGSFLEKDFDRHAKEIWGVDKFDIIVQNPPYQKESDNKKQTHPIWHFFIERSIKLLKKGGYLCAIHPSGWRAVSGMFKGIQKEILKNQILSLKMKSVEDGLQTFGAQIRFDFYCLQNDIANSKKTKITGIDGETEEVILSNLEFIPNGAFNLVQRLMAKEGEPKLEVLYSCESHSQKDYVNRNRTEKFMHPCVYSINCKGHPTFLFSSKKSSHFGISKLIVPNGDARSIDFLEDPLGEYGMTEFAFGIVEKCPKTLKKYRETLLNKDFINFHNKYLCIGMSKYNRNTLALFRKDFWKEFIPKKEPKPKQRK